MAQIPNKKSLTLTLTSVGAAGTDIPVEFTEARNYTKFTIDLPAAVAVTQHTLQVNAGSGWKDLYTSVNGTTQQVTITAQVVNMLELTSPMKGGIRLLCRTNDAAATEHTIYVTMSGSLYSESRGA